MAEDAEREMGRVSWLGAILGTAVITSLLAPVHEQINSTTVALSVLLIVLFVALFWGSRPALLASVLAMLSFNFFFLPPLYTFNVVHAENWIALVAFFTTALAVGQLSGRAKKRAEEAESGKREIERLYKQLQAAFEQASHTEALRQSEKLKSALLDAVTHDLRTPLASSRGFPVVYAVTIWHGGSLDKQRHKLREEKQTSATGPDLSNGPAIPLPDVELEDEEIHRSYFVTDEVTAPSNWKKSIVINAVGPFATFTVLCVFIATKFLHGAWIVVVVIPLLVLLFRAIHKHYLMVARQLSTEGLGKLRSINHTVIVPISGIHRGVVCALQYAKSIAQDHVQAVYVDFEEEATTSIKNKWERWGRRCRIGGAAVALS